MDSLGVVVTRGLGVPDVSTPTVDPRFLSSVRDRPAGARRLNRGLPVVYLRCDAGRLPALSGTVIVGSPGSTPLSGWPVLLRDPDGTVVSQGKTEPDGRYSLAGADAAPGLWTVSVLTSRGERVLGRVAVRVDPVLTVTQDLRGRRLSVNGRLLQAGPVNGKLILLEWRSLADKSWRPLARTNADTNGNFAFTYRFNNLPTAGRVQMRVVVPTELGWPHAEIHGNSWTPATSSKAA